MPTPTKRNGLIKPNIKQILNKSLNDNGYFIITFLDNRNIDKLFGEKDLTFYEKDNEIM